MPFVRCWYYTESGEPRGGGCRRKGTGCAFVHPDDPNWNNAPPPASRARDRGGESGGSKGWDVKRSMAASSARDTGSTNTADTAGGWSAVNPWGDGSKWGTGSGWDNSTGLSTTGSTSTPTGTTSRDTSAPVNERNQGDASSTANGKPENGEHGRGGSADKPTKSGWGSPANGRWEAPSWGNDKEADKATESGWGSTRNEGRGAGWGNKDADNTVGSGWGNTQNVWGASSGNTDKAAGSGWGCPGSSGRDASGWGNNKDTISSSAASDPMATDKQPERNKGKSKAVPAPPRIRIPDNENKKFKITGTNNEPLGSSKWGEPRSSNLIITSTPVTASTPIATAITPTDSSRLKRKRDVAFDDKLDVFKEYIKTWERGVRARFLLAEAEAKRDRWFRTQKSACYARIGEAGRKRLDGERAECDKEVNAQREKLSCAITSLVEFHDSISSNLDLGQRYNIGEQAEKFITESKTFVDEVRRLLVEHVLKDKSDGDAREHSSGADTNASPINCLRNHVRELEERFDQAQTELTLRHRRDIRTQVDEILTAKIAALRVAREREIDRVASLPRPEIVIPSSALEKIEGTAEQVRELDVKVPHTVEDIRVLLHRVDSTTKRVIKLEEELSVNKATYKKQVQEMVTEKEETERRIDQRLEKIREQFEQLVASQPTSPAAQPAVSRDKLMESVRPAFEAALEKFYKQEVQPTIASLQRVVIQASDLHQEDAIRVLWGKIQPAMNMVADVSRWLDSQELRLTAPIEADHV